jgi:hypothetical protein
VVRACIGPGTLLPGISRPATASWHLPVHSGVVSLPYLEVRDVATLMASLARATHAFGRALRR